jgi:hypothetical protein
MVWFNVDDGLTTSPKVLAIPRGHRLAAIGLWTMAGSWCGQHLTDGAVPAFMLDEWGATKEMADVLVEVGLWRKTAKGFQFHAWDEYQQSRNDVEAKRERDRQRKQAYREKIAGQQASRPRGTQVGQDVGLQEESSPPNPSLPNPSLPSPTHPVKDLGAAKRGSRVPDPFVIEASMRSWALENAPAADPDRETPQFVDHWAAKAGKDALKVDWRRAWQTWMRNAQRFAERDGWKPVDNVTQLRDVTAERQAAQKAKWLSDHGVTEAEYEAHKHDVDWIRRVTGGDSA